MKDRPTCQRLVLHKRLHSAGRLHRRCRHSVTAKALFVAILLSASGGRAATPAVTTLVGTGVPGFSDLQVNNPYGLVIGPDGGLYFCDLDNQRIRRFDFATKRLTTVAGSGERGYRGDGGPATAAALNMPHELRFDRMGDLFIAERDNHVIRKVDHATGLISTVAGTGTPGFSGDGGPAAKRSASPAAQPRRRHRRQSAGVRHRQPARSANPSRHRDDRDRTRGTGEARATPDGAAVSGTPLNGPRTLALAPNGDLYLALREGNSILRIDRATQTFHHVAGTGQAGYSGDGGPARNATLAGPKGLAIGSDHSLYVADTENHVVRRIDLGTGVITTVLGTGTRGDGPESDPMACKLSRPHGVFEADGAVYVADSEAHRIRIVR